MNSFRTARFGELTYADRDVITLPEGLVGLPSLRRWILLDMGAGLPLKWMQSIDDGDFGLPVTTPDFYDQDYVPRVSEETFRAMGGPAADLVTLIITTVHPGGERLTGNLAAPVVVHPVTRRGAQLVLDDQRWPLRQEMDYVRFGLAAQAGAAEAAGPAADLTVATPEGERQEIAL
ncbi:MAG: flagellar assembly protein FliW [Candidatus Krumholzibacteriia bacterium]